MKRTSLYLLPLLLLAAGVFASCEETEETSIYDNWRQRNEQFIDSIAQLTEHRYSIYDYNNDKVDQLVEAIDAEPAGKLFAIETTASTNESGASVPQYVYCKKITAPTAGRVPLYRETVSAYYYGTLIIGTRFDGNFTGYSALDQGELEDGVEGKCPTEFDSPTEFTVNGVIPGWTAALQYMHEGERWMLYVPWQSAYGASGRNGIQGYTALTFDLELAKVKE